MGTRKRREPGGGMADCALLAELADAYQPLLRWARSERFFPVLAEAWLQLSTSAAWPGQPVGAEAVPADPRRRGTAVCTGDPTAGTVTQIAGSPNPGGRPVQLTADADDLDAIGGDGIRKLAEEAFLSVGGWAEAYRRGDVDYLSSVFSELSAAINPAMVWDPMELLGTVPVAWTAQPPSPTVYVEAEWGTRWAQRNDRAGLSDFPPGAARELGRFLCLTYYYLYPAREPSPGETGPRRQEGQWEAITLFFPAEGSEDHGGETRLFVQEPPTHVVISKGTDPTTGKYLSEYRPWNRVEHEGDQPVIYVASGTHRHYFEAADKVTFPGPTGDPATPTGGLDTAGDSEFPGQEWLLVLAAIAAAFGPWGWLLALLFLLLWLISLIWEAVNQSSGDPLDPWSSNDQAPGDGPQAGGGAPPAGGLGSGGPPGATNAGAPDGYDTVGFDIRLVNSLQRREKPSPYPPDEVCERPAWWDYTGSWGIRVAQALDNDWENSTRRVDRFGRSWGYWHTLRLMTALHGGSWGP